MKLELVASTPAKRCSCELCDDADHAASYSIHRERRLAHEAELPPSARSTPEQLEDYIASRWHAYVPWIDKLVDKLDYRAFRFATDKLRQTETLRKTVAWYDSTNENVDLNRWGNGNRSIAILAGGHGTGKTVAAIHIAVHREADNRPVFIGAARLQEQLRKRRSINMERPLFVDDLGVEVMDKWFASAFDELVNRFYQDTIARLVITTNCTLKEFRARYGERVLDRIAEGGVWIAATGKSLRRRG